MNRTKTLLARKPKPRLFAAVNVAAGLALLGYAVVHVFAAGAASLYFAPASGSYTAGSTLSVQVMVNTAGESVNAVQADFTYPTSRLQFASIDATGSAFDVAASGTGGGGSVSIARGKIGTVTGTALVATVRFTVLSSAGSAALAFQGSSAVVRSSDNTNVLGSTPGATYTVVVPTPVPPTPTPTPVHTATPQKTPTPVPGTTTKTPTPTPTKTPTGGSAATTPTPTVASNTTPHPAATPTPTSSAAPVAAPSSPGPNSFATFVKNASHSSLTTVAAALAGLVLLGIGVGVWLTHRHQQALALVGGHGSSQMPDFSAQPAAAPTPMPPAPSAAPGSPQDAPNAPVYYPQSQDSASSNNDQTQG
jgi:hypothetical protein